MRSSIVPVLRQADARYGHVHTSNEHFRTGPQMDRMTHAETPARSDPGTELTGRCYYGRSDGQIPLRSFRHKILTTQRHLNAGSSTRLTI